MKAMIQADISSFTDNWEQVNKPARQIDLDVGTISEDVALNYRKKEHNISAAICRYPFSVLAVYTYIDGETSYV